MYYASPLAHTPTSIYEGTSLLVKKSSKLTFTSSDIFVSRSTYSTTVTSWFAGDTATQFTFTVFLKSPYGSPLAHTPTLGTNSPVRPVTLPVSSR